MKNLITLLAILIGGVTQAQEVSPYYPAKNVVKDPYHFTSQITYFDMNYSTNNISEFMKYRLNMAVTKTDDSKLLHTGGTYIIEYTDRLSFSGGKNLIFTYNVGKVNDIYTIKSLKITGSKERLISFFVEFWQTSINFEKPSGKSDVSLRTGQDVAKFFFNKGAPFITVSNSSYKNIEDFKEYFNKLIAEKVQE